MQKFRRTVFLWTILPFLFLFAACSGGHRAEAENVFASAKPFGSADSIYVAGNPDLYPIEYYNPRSGNYEGLFPELLKRVSSETGLIFTYVSAGNEDRRAALASNMQVEIISAVLPEDNISGRGTGSIVSAMLNGHEITPEFVFTDAASDELYRLVSDKLSSVPESVRTVLALKVAADHFQSDLRVPLILFAASLLVLAAAVLTVVLRKRKKKTRNDIRFIDDQTGLGNKVFFDSCFSYLSDEERYLYVIGYFSFDMETMIKTDGISIVEQHLRSAAIELAESAATSDFIARIGNGFAVAHPCYSEAAAKEWATERLNRLNHGQDFSEISDFRCFRAGLYRLKRSDRNPDAALFNAQQGYYQAAREKCPVIVCDETFLRDLEFKLRLGQESRLGLEKNEFKLFLQLFVDAKTGAVSGGEALTRWDHPERGILHPGAFIEVMEQENLIWKLDYCMLENVCSKLSDWKKSDRPYLISCNFTRSTLESDQFPSMIEDVLTKYDFNPNQLVLEITEDLLETDKALLEKNLMFCKSKNFMIALDDIGSGATSFGDLRDYPIDIVKIDKSLIPSSSGTRGYYLLKGLVSMAHDMGMSVLCEGIETEEALQTVRNAGCDMIQGFLFYRAMPASEVDKFLGEPQNK